MFSNKEFYKFVDIFFSPTAQFAGEDPVVALEAALQVEDTREFMQAFCVGQYMEVCLTLCYGFNLFYFQNVWISCFFLVFDCLSPAQPGNGDNT